MNTERGSGAVACLGVLEIQMRGGIMQYRTGCFFPNRARGGTSGATLSASVLAGPGKIVVDVGRALGMGFNPAPGYDAPSLAYQQNNKQVCLASASQLQWLLRCV